MITSNRAGYMNKSKSNDWTTPKDLYEKLDKEFNFNFDPCPLNPDFDGLNIEWKERNFVNPPFSNLAEWIKKSYDESKKGKLVVMLIPSRTDTKAFKKYVLPHARIRFIKGRLKYGDSKSPAPFPSCIVIFDGDLK